MFRVGQVVRGLRLGLRPISTSGKRPDPASGVTIPQNATSVEPKPPVTAEDFSDIDRNWVSYGYDETDKTKDDNYHHAAFFFSVSICLVLGGFNLAYRPDYLFRDWSGREAFLELRRREALGLPLIDPNYVDPATIHLPSEEELKGVEIVI